MKASQQFPRKHRPDFLFEDWCCILDYEDMLKPLIEDPWSVEGLDMRASILAQYLIRFRPDDTVNREGRSDDTQTSADIQETLAPTMLISKSYITQFMLYLGYRLLPDTDPAVWDMKHVDSL